MKYATDALFGEAVAARRWLHAHPEVDFDLDETVAFVKARLNDIGIPFTERFCESSVCGFLGDQSGAKPIIAPWMRSSLAASVSARPASSSAFSATWAAVSFPAF